jgi:hypothetical protein
MDLIDKGGKPYVVYMDAEFQTYRSPKDNDLLAKAGFKLTPPFVHYANDHKFNTYQFLLNIAFIIIDDNKNFWTYLATFPSLYGDSPFDDGRLLEPAYTVVSPDITKKMEAERPKVKKFEFLSNMDSEEAKAGFIRVNDLYQSEMSPEKLGQSMWVLNYLLKTLIPQSKLIHKGNTDLDAIHNTCLFYKLDIPRINSRNLDHFSDKFVGLYGETHDKKLETLQGLFCKYDRDLLALRESMIANTNHYMETYYGVPTVAKAHNPLVDCVYALILDIAVTKYLKG